MTTRASPAVSSGPVDYIEPGDIIEGYLSRIVQDGIDRKDALVVRRRIQDRVAFLLLRKGEPDVGLSASSDPQFAFSEAKQACHALAKAERARRTRP